MKRHLSLLVNRLLSTIQGQDSDTLLVGWAGLAPMRGDIDRHMDMCSPADF